MLSGLLTSDDLHALYRLRAEREDNEEQSVTLVAKLIEAGEPVGTIASVSGLTERAIAHIATTRSNYERRPLHNMCRKYYIGKVSRAELVDFLVNFEYGPRMKFDEFGESDSNGWDTWFDVDVSLDCGYIDEDLYYEVDGLLERTNDGSKATTSATLD